MDLQNLDLAISLDDDVELELAARHALMTRALQVSVGPVDESGRAELFMTSPACRCANRCSSDGAVEAHMDLGRCVCGCPEYRPSLPANA